MRHPINRPKTDHKNLCSAGVPDAQDFGLFFVLNCGVWRSQNEISSAVAEMLQIGQYCFHYRRQNDAISMSSPNDHEPPSAESSDDLKGLDVLLVEDERYVGEALKKHLELLGANVAGPATSTAEAEMLLTDHLPDVALVDFHLRGGEQSYGLIARLRAQGVPVIMLSGSFESPPLPSLGGAILLEKPVSEAQLLAHLTPLIAKKALR